MSKNMTCVSVCKDCGGAAEEFNFSTTELTSIRITTKLANHIHLRGLTWPLRITKLVNFSLYCSNLVIKDLAINRHSSPQ